MIFSLLGVNYVSLPIFAFALMVVYFVEGDEVTNIDILKLIRSKLKELSGLMIIVIPVFALLYFSWHFTPMYRETITSQRIAAQSYLLNTYNDNAWAVDREALIKKYGFAEDEINPLLFIRKCKLDGFKR